MGIGLRGGKEKRRLPPRKTGFSGEKKKKKNIDNTTFFWGEKKLFHGKRNPYKRRALFFRKKGRFALIKEERGNGRPKLGEKDRRGATRGKKGEGGFVLPTGLPQRGGEWWLLGGVSPLDREKGVEKGLLKESVGEVGS